MTRFPRTRRFASSRLGRRPGLFLLLLLGILTVLAVPALSAQEASTRTTPIDGEILERWPRAAVVSFDSSLDPDASTLSLVDIHGQDVPNTSSSVTADGQSLSLALPSDIPDGVYSLVWDVTVEDGTLRVGYSSFSVGNPEDASILTIPSTTGPGGSDGPPQWLQTGARWSALVGILAAMATWPAWTLIVRPSIAPAWRRGPRVQAAMQQFAFIAFSLAFLGSLLELAVHSQTLADGTWFDKLMNTLGNTDWGFWWLLRMLVLVFLGIGLSTTAWWFPRRRPIRMAAAWVLSLLVGLPVSATSHAAEDSVGRIAAVGSNYLHLLSAGLWAGSAVIIGTVLLPRLRGLSPLVSRAVFSRLAIRFGGVTIVSWLMLLLTGAYATWLFAGNWTALSETDYGRALLAKLALTAVAIVLVAIGMVLTRRLAASPTAEGTSRVRWLLLAQGALVLVILVAVGRMNTTPSARDVIVEQSQQATVPVEFPGRESLYMVAPGRAGVNHLRLEVGGNYIPNDAEAFITVSSPDYPKIGSKEFQMYRVPGNAFEHHGTEFAMVGDWEITVRLVEPGFEDLTYTFSQHIAEENTTLDVPARAWRFETLGGTAALILLIVGSSGIVIAAYAGKGPTRKEAGSLGAVALVMAVVLISQARLDPILAVGDDEGAINPNDMAMVTRGEEVYTTYCMQCHGPELRGDGPLNESLNPPASDFAEPHTFVHSDADLIFWIQNGKQGTAMPGFDAQLTDQDVRDVIAFIQNWQANFDGSESAASNPVSATCEVAPIEFSRIPEIFHHGIMPDVPRGTPLIRAADQTVDGDTVNEVMWSVEQVVACTNADETLSRLRLFSEPLLQELFPNGADQRLTMATTSRPEPLAAGEQVRIEDVQSITWLADGRIAVTVIFNDPAGAGIAPGAGVITQVTLVMLEVEGGWIVDELR